MALPRVRVGVQVWGVSVLLLACGGRSTEHVVSGGGAPDNHGGSSSGAGLTSSFGGGDSQDPGMAGTGTDGTMNAGTANGGVGGAVPTSIGGAGGDCTNAACTLSATPSPLWATEVRSSGRGAASIRFSESGELVRVAAGESWLDSSTLDRATGEIKTVARIQKLIVAEDASGRRVVQQGGDGFALMTLDGVEAFRLRGHPRRPMQFSPDGSALAAYSCVAQAEDLIQLDVYDTDSGQLLAEVQASLPCIYRDVAMLVDTQRRRTLFGHPDRSELFVHDWDSSTVATHAIHDSARVSVAIPRNHEGTILNLSLAPSGRALVSVGAADGLAWLDPDTLAVEFRLPDVPFFNVYDRCYCTYLSESPVAWSPTGDIYAVSHPSGGIALREVATQEELVVLEPPKDADVIRQPSSSEFGPYLVAFSPDMRHLVALYPGVAVGYSLSQD